ncbi:MAG: hypothetical protein RL219_1185 [Actinomycetota bacterium]
MVAVNSTNGAAIDAAIADSNGSVTLDVGSTALAQVRISVSRQGYGSSSITGASATNSVALKASQNNALKFANVYGAQTRGVLADAESGVFYALTDGSPSVWRTVDYAGSWAGVPTVADATTGIAQGQATKAAVSGYPGEIAVIVQNAGLWYSRDYGTTWASLATTGNFSDVWWAHSGTSSYLFARVDGQMRVAVMSAATPALTAWTLPAGMGQSDLFAVAAAAQSANQVFAASVPQNGNTSATVYRLAVGATSASGVTAASTVSTTGLTAESTSTQDLLMISALGGSGIAAVVVYDKSGQGNNLGGSSGALRTAYSSDGSTFTYGTGTLMTPGQSGQGVDFSGFNGWTAVTSVGSGCGENETAPVGSIAPVSPAAAGYTAFKLVGSVRGCLFALNTSGAVANWGGSASAPVGAGQAALLPMQGANNATGLAFDGGFDFSSNQVAISGDGQFGLRKSAVIDPTSLRPRFSTTGVQGVADEFIMYQAKPGKGTDSGGIAVNGIVSPAVQDIAMAPNSTDGSTYLVSSGISGGSRTLLTTDGGKSFSTVNTAGATKMTWWNGPGSRQWIVGSAPLNSSILFRSKNFTTERGAAPTQMGDELSATAVQRDSVTDTSLRFTADSAMMPMGAQCFGIDQFYATGQQCNNGVDYSSGRIDLTAAAGVTGTDMVLLGVSKGDSERQQATSGTVGLATLTAEPSSAGTVSSVRYFGTAVAPGGTTSNATTNFGVGATTTYGGRIRSIAYCPAGSAAKLADKAFIAVEGKGMFVISGIAAGNPQHASTSTTSTLTDLKADCDTGILMAGTSGSGLQVSFDADKFAAVRTGGLPSDPKVVDFQASKDTGEVSVVMGTGGQSVVQWDTTIPKMGTTSTALTGGSATTPTEVPATTSEVLTLNDGAKGRQIGRIEDVELPAATGDPEVKSAAVQAQGVSAMGLAAFAAGDSVANIGSATGSYVSSSALARQNLAALTVGTGTPTPGTSAPAASKVSSVKKGKSITLVAAMKKAGAKIPAGATVTISQTAASKKICAVLNKKTIKGLKKGTCSITVKVTPKRTSKTVKVYIVTTKVKVSVT